MNQGLRHKLDEVFASRDRNNIAPTIAAFLSILEAHPDEPEVLYEAGGAYDTAGQEATPPAIIGEPSTRGCTGNGCGSDTCSTAAPCETSAVSTRAWRCWSKASRSFQTQNR